MKSCRNNIKKVSELMRQVRHSSPVEYEERIASIQAQMEQERAASAKKLEVAEQSHNNDMLSARKDSEKIFEIN